MLFLHSDPVHVNVRSEDRDDRGRLIRGGKRRLFADFQRGTAPEYARVIGVQTFGMSNRPEEIEADRWLSSYDSVAAQAQHGWSDEDRQLIEQRLIELGYLLVEKPKIAAPYPMYDKHRAIRGVRRIEHAIKDIVTAYETAGFDLEHAILYEQQEGADPRVLEALEGLREKTEVEGNSLISA